MKGSTKMEGRSDLDALHRQLDEDQVIERSVLGTLSAAEQERFEEHFLTCDRCLDQLEASQRLRTALRGVAVEEGVRRQRLGLLAQWLVVWRSVALRPWWIAGLSLVALGTVWWQLDADRQRLRSRLELALAPPERTFLVPLDVSRSTPGSGESGQVLELAGGPEWIVLSLPITELIIEPTAGAAETAYAVRLVNAKEETVWRRQGLTADDGGRVLFGLPSASLVAGRYAVHLEPEGSPGDVRRFPITVRSSGE